MPPSWFGKKEPDETEMPEIPTPETDAGGGDLERLSRQLGSLGQLLEAANRKIGDYLLQRESRAAATATQDTPVAAGLADRIAELVEKMEKLAASRRSAGDRSDSAADAPSAPPPAPLPEEVLRPVLQKLDILDQQNTALYQTVEQLAAHLDGGIRSLAELILPSEQPAAPGDEPGAGGDWVRAILGPELAVNAGLAQPCRRLVSGVLAEDPDSQALAGQLLVFQSAPPERLPQLLKDLGEAFYRWEPKTSPESSPVEQALVGWVQRRCEAAGIANTIALVHPGERFDSARHTATTRGVEIVRVHGWIVARDNGKVYTKAAVTVR